MTKLDRNGTLDDSAGFHDAPPGMLEDVFLLDSLDEEPIRQISEQLRSSGGMLSPDRIAEIVNLHLTGDEAEAVARIVANIAPMEIPNVIRLLQERARRGKREPLTPSESTIGKVSGNLKLLVQDYPALRLMHKAQRLLRETGNEVRSVVFVCDLRPVYDDEHTEIVGFVPLVNMQIGYIKQNGDAKFFEAALTGDELRQFLDSGQDALNKLRILENMLHDPSETEDLQ